MCLSQAGGEANVSDDSLCMLTSVKERGTLFEKGISERAASTSAHSVKSI